jgi:coenzyme PQQ precursor peptide PqqA
MPLLAIYSRSKYHDASEGYMTWNTPRILEVCAGYEVTAYSGAELDDGEILR